MKYCLILLLFSVLKLNAQLPAFSEMANYTPGLLTYQTQDALQKCTDAGDLNMDGYNDIVFAGKYSTSNTVISIQYGNCYGFFMEGPDTIDVPFISGPSAVRLVDINNDGYLDILVSGSGTVGYYQNNGTGWFDAPVLTQVPVPGIIPGRTEMSIADFNHDGYHDIFISIRNLSVSSFQASSVLTGNGNGNFTLSPINYNAVTSLPFGGNDTADVNNDGWTDIVIAARYVLINIAGQLDNQLTFALNSPYPNAEMLTVRTVQADSDPQTEYFGVSDTLLVYGELNTANPPLAITFSQSSIIKSFDVGDFDGDGFKDDVMLSFQSANSKIYYGNNNTLTLVSTDYTAPVTGKIFAADIDQDGDDDLFYSGSQKILMNMGNFRFTYQNNIPLNGTVRSTCSADFNLDGFEDAAVIVNAAVAKTLSILYGKDCGFDGIFEYPGTIQYHEIKTGHFNNDSLPDIIISNQLYDSIYIYLNLGNKLFAPKQAYYTGHNLIQPAVADFDEDGYDDLFLLSTSPVRYNMMYADPSGNGTFGPAGPILNAATINVFGADPEVADFNMDGHADVIISHDNALGQRMTILSGDGTGNFTKNPVLMTSATTYCVPIKLNPDSLPDIISTGGSLGTITNFICSDTLAGQYIPNCHPSISSGASTITTGDFNNDSIADFTLNSITNAVLTSLPYVLKPDYTPYYLQQIITAGNSKAASVDFNNDGFDDLLYYSGNLITPFQNTMPGSPIINFINDTLYVTSLRTTNIPLSYEWYKDGVLIAGAGLNYLPVSGFGLYQVGVTYTNWTYATAKYEVNIFSGIKESDNFKFEIYPNPATSDISLKFTRINSGKVELFDINSKIITEINLLPGQDNIQIPVNTLNAGLYFIRITSENSSGVKKFVKH